jgi:hypothetical protein
MFDITQQYQQVRVCRIDNFQQTFEPISTSAPEMQTMGGEVCLNTEMEVSNNQ